jgi:hypothetical protein
MKTVNQPITEEEITLYSKLKDYFKKNITWKKVIKQGLKYYKRQMNRSDSK